MLMSASAWGQQKRDTILINDNQRIDEVVVRGNAVSRVNTSAFSVTAVDTRQLRNTNQDLGKILDKVSGLKVREDGGVGSSASINLNGFTGKHVKIFLDGVPMEGASSSFGINNIPSGFASRIEVYKGVVPVNFGGDALGGVINIVSDRTPRTYVDVSYSYGSFNTHRTNISVGLFRSNGLSLRLNAYQNYSDNDYKVKTQWTDLKTNAVSKEERWFRRFHDKYHNEAVIVRMGVENKPWTDRLIVGANYSQEYAQIQNANLMKIVFGGKHRTAHGVAPSLLYEKRNIVAQGLNLRLSARYDIVRTNNVDTLNRTYSWTGEYKEKSYQGEGVATLAEYKGYTLACVGNLTYNLGAKHYLTANNTYSHYRRRTTNSAANSVQSSAATFMRRISVKNVLGVSYRYIGDADWDAQVFVKTYNSRVTGPVNISSTGRAEYEEQSRDISAIGRGGVGTHRLLYDLLQLKWSYERTYRMPSARELFGDGDYEESNATLKPEKSDNINLNISLRFRFGAGHEIDAESGFNYRLVNDYIIRTIGQSGVAVSTNHGKMLGLGADISLHYMYRETVSVGGSFTRQSMRDKERLNSIGAPSATYNDQAPNLPFEFAEADASYTFKKVAQEGNRLTIGWSLHYVHKFYRSWDSEGAKLYVPKQLSQDINMVYSMRDGRYNVAFEANNLTDALLYDNYSLQKPGRNFALKLRYMFFKKKSKTTQINR